MGAVKSLCNKVCFGPIEDDIYILRERIRDESPEGLMRQYISIAKTFDASNVYLIESNIEFGRLNHIEKVIIEVQKNKTTELYMQFLRAKRHIDLLINPEAPAAPVAKTEPRARAKVHPIGLYGVKIDYNKKKYRSVLVVTRTDFTGFEATKIPTVT